MSTKCTVAYSNDPETDFHFYQECFDDDALYLELRGQDIQYEAGPGCVMVRIPLEIWEVMRQRAPVDLKYADWTDEEIEVEAAREVDEQIARYEEYVSDGNTGGQKLLRIWGADKPREEQLETRLSFYREWRDRDTERKRKIDSLLKAQWNHD